MIGLVDKDVKTAIINILPGFWKADYVSVMKKMKHIKKIPIELLEKKKIQYLKYVKQQKLVLTLLWVVFMLFKCSFERQLLKFKLSPVNLLFFHPSPLRWLCLGAG